MFTFNISTFYTQATIDVSQYKKDLDKVMKTQMRQAARAWLRAVIPLVPVYTGTSRGSLTKLGAFLKVAVPIIPVAKEKGQGIHHGARQATFSFGDGPKYSFRFNENVYQYIINEFYNVSHILPLKTPGPYESFKAGTKAFAEYMNTNLPKHLPKVEDHIKFRRDISVKRRKAKFGGAIKPR